MVTLGRTSSDRIISECSISEVENIINEFVIEKSLKFEKDYSKSLAFMFMMRNCFDSSSVIESFIRSVSSEISKRSEKKKSFTLSDIETIQEEVLSEYNSHLLAKYEDFFEEISPTDIEQMYNFLRI